MASDAGPFYFAWVNPEETTFGPEHHRVDEEMVRFERRHEEGDFCKFTADVRNPRVGPLAASRKFWAWISWQSDSDVVPLFFGRLIGIPSNILGEVITYEFIARPLNYTATKNALASSLRVLPYYDEIFVDEKFADDADVVLDGYSAVWHIDPVTHELSKSDVLIGEAGTAVFTAEDIIRDSVEVSMAEVPLSSVTVTASFPWKQRAQGTLNMGSRRFLTYTGGSLVGNWPKTGDSLSGGYYVVQASASDDFGIGSIEPVSWSINYTNRAKKHNDGDLLSFTESFSGPSQSNGGGPLGGTTIHDYQERVTGDPYTGTPASFSRNRQALMVPLWQVSTNLVLGIDAERDRQDNVRVTLASDIQPVLRDPSEDDEPEVIDLPARDVSHECGSDAALIGSTGRAEYATTDRGLSSIEYMVLIARARLRLASRAVRVVWQCPFALAVGLRPNWSAQIFDDRIPGGDALGKVVSCSLIGDGTTGEFRGRVEIACAVGLGNSIATADGTGDYVDVDYMDDYQTFTGQVVAIDTGDAGFSPPILISGGGGQTFGLTKSNLVIREEVLSSPGEQGDAIAATFSSFPPLAGVLNPSAFFAKLHEERVRAAAEAMANTQMWYELELRDLTSGEIEAQFSVPTENLVIPRQIDLTADVSI